MQKIVLLCIMAMVCLIGKDLYAQGDERDIRTLDHKLFVHEWLDRDVPLGNFVNYPKTTASLSEFKDKLIIFGFWFTSCSVCIEEFPNELALQQKFRDSIQFILITYQPEKQVIPFLKSWEVRNQIAFDLPVIVSDTLLRKAFHQYYNPSYVWVLPNGKIVGQSTQHMINENTITGLLNEYRGSIFQIESQGK